MVVIIQHSATLHQSQTEIVPPLEDAVVLLDAVAAIVTGETGNAQVRHNAEAISGK
jgi:hypothetical protein